jgi:hypothetical protein
VRDFTAERPNQRWVADITEFATDEGKLYVAGVRDLCTGPGRPVSRHRLRVSFGSTRRSQRPVLQVAVLSADIHFVENRIDVAVRPSAFSQFVSIDVDGHVPSDNWFHLEPGGCRTIGCRARGASLDVARCHVRALKAPDAVHFYEKRGRS